MKFIVSITFVFFVIAVIPAVATTITVDDDEIADYDSIQEAVKNATAGDTILVYPGTYIENIDINKKLAIISHSGNPNDTIINAANSEDDVFYVTANEVTISGFKMTGARIDEYGNDKAGIWLDGAQNCLISENNLSNNLGIFLTNSNNNKLINNTVTQNGLIGIWMWTSSNNELNGNNVILNKHEGIVLYSGCSSNILYNNTVTLNSAGIFLYQCNKNVLNSNFVSNNSLDGIAVIDSSSNVLSNNTANSNPSIGFKIVGSSNILNNNTANSNGYGYLLAYAGNCVLNNNHAIWNSVDGIYLTKSANNELNGNNVSNNSRYGIYVDESSKNNTLNYNIAISNGGEDVHIDDIKNNTIDGRPKDAPFVSSMFTFSILLVAFLVLNTRKRSLRLR